VPRWLSLVDASRNREHPPRKRNGSILPRKVAGSNPARGSTLQERSTPFMVLWLRSAASGTTTDSIVVGILP